MQATDSTSHGEDHEGESRLVRAEGAHSKRLAALQQRTYRALPLVAELRRTVQQPDHLVCRRHQRVSGHHPQGIHVLSTLYFSSD